MPSLSQKYRPKTFADITGQEHVTETLRREVATGKLGHAYLFSGPRGVGKTTAARVFAKALNCEKPNDGEPCNACPPCVALNEGRCLDLIELDAATHTGIENIRESVIEHVRFGPMLGKRKIYVLDEAHGLSGPSWNALLKTLEEPPPYAFFILATTEWHKVPTTIVSRCQRFEFRRIADEPLAERLKDLAKREGWKVDDAVVNLIVSRADGCVRDAETLLGQLGALVPPSPSGSPSGRGSVITLEVAGLVIPPSHLPLAAGFLGRWARRDHAASLAEAQRLFDEGIPILPLFDDLLSIVRKLLTASGDPSVASLAGAFSPPELNDLALLLMERRRDVKGGVDPLFALQLAGTAVANGMLKHSVQVSSKAVDTPKHDQTDPSPEPSQQSDATRYPAKLDPVSRDKLQATSSPMDIDMIRMQWNAIVRTVEEKNHSLPFILKISRPEELRGSTLVIRFQYTFHRDKVVSDAKHRRIVEEAARSVLGDDRLVIDGIVGEDAEAQTRRSHDMVANVLKAFGGSVVE